MVLSNCCCKPLIHTSSDRSSKIVRDLSFFKLYIYDAKSIGLRIFVPK